jgi:hypothetical protein
MNGINFAFSLFGIAYAAFFVWLVIRIINRREKWVIKLAIYSGIAFIIIAFTTPFVVILFLDMVGRHYPTTEEFILLFIPFAIFIFLLGKWILPFPFAKRGPECEPDDPNVPITYVDPPGQTPDAPPESN